MDAHPLKPLTHGNILIIGAKASNFSDEIKNHPRVLIWDSQNEHWTNKDLPSNVQAVFVTRWIGHTPFARILAEARKKHITMFNPEGTGMIAKQVKELLSMTKSETVWDPSKESIRYEKPQTHQVKEHKGGLPPKLNVLLPHIEWDKSNTLNAKNLMQRLHEFHITSTEASLANFIGQQRRKLFPEITAHRRTQSVPSVTPKIKTESQLDVSVQLLDNAIKELKDMRDFLIETVKENEVLKQKIATFRKLFNE